MTDLRGLRALVTGGATGIGAASATLLASRGAEVVVADVNTSAGEALAAQIGARFAPVDVTSPHGWPALPPFDLAHLNAGTMTKLEPCLMEDLTPQNWRRVHDVNVEGVMNGLFAILPGMQERGSGSIVVMGSLAAFVGFGDDPYYGCTKALLVNLARALAGPLRSAGIRINAVCPGEVETRMLPPGRAELLRSRGYRPLTPGEVADVVVETLLGTETGEVFTLVTGAGREPYGFPGVPKPRRTVT